MAENMEEILLDKLKIFADTQNAARDTQATASNMQNATSDTQDKKFITYTINRFLNPVPFAYIKKMLSNDIAKPIILSQALFAGNFRIIEYFVSINPNFLKNNKTVQIIYEVSIKKKNYKFLIKFIKAYRQTLTEDNIHTIYNILNNLKSEVINKMHKSEILLIQNLIELIVNCYIMYNKSIEIAVHNSKELGFEKINEQIEYIITHYYFYIPHAERYPDCSPAKRRTFLLLMKLMIKFQHQNLCNVVFLKMLDTHDPDVKKEVFILLVNMYNKIYFKHRYDDELYSIVIENMKINHPYNDGMIIYLNNELTQIDKNATPLFYETLNSASIDRDKKAQLIDNANAILSKMNCKKILKELLKSCYFINLTRINTEINKSLYDEILLSFYLNNHKVYYTYQYSNSLCAEIIRRELRVFQEKTVRSSLTYDNYETIYYMSLPHHDFQEPIKLKYCPSIIWSEGIPMNLEKLRFFMERRRIKVIEEFKKSYPAILPLELMELFCAYLMY